MRFNGKKINVILMLSFLMMLFLSPAIFAHVVIITMKAPHIHAYEKLPIIFGINNPDTGEGYKGLQPVINMQKAGEEKQYEITLKTGEIEDAGDGTYKWIHDFTGVGFYTILFSVKEAADYTYRSFPLEIAKAGGERIFKPSKEEAKYNYQIRWGASPASPKPGDKVTFDIELKRTFGSLNIEEPWTNKFEHLTPLKIKKGIPAIVVETSDGKMVRDITSTVEYLGLGVYKATMEFLAATEAKEKSNAMGKSAMDESADAKKQDTQAFKLHVSFQDDANYLVDETGTDYDFEVKNPGANSPREVVVKSTEKTVNNYSVKLFFKDKTAKEGRNDIIVSLADAARNPLDANKVTVTAEMDKSTSMIMDMENVKPVTAELVAAGNKPGDYKGKLDLKYKGTWNMQVKFMLGDKESSTDYNIEVKSGGPNWAFIGTFLGVIVLIILLAAFLKKSRAKKSQA